MGDQINTIEQNKTGMSSSDPVTQSQSHLHFSDSCRDLIASPHLSLASKVWPW